MAPLSAKWHPLAHLPSVPRSSHTLSVLHSTLHHFSGESHDNRPPSGAELHLLPLDPTVPLAITILASPSGPSPRVDAAAATLDDTLYVFGGRGGADMSPLEEGGRLWSFTAGAQSWEAVDPVDGGEFPSARGGHALVAAEGRVYVHAGVAESGMLGDLWAFVVAERRWVRLRDAPGGERSAVGMAVTGGREIWRFAGWDGVGALGGEVGVYDIQHDTWRTIEYPPSTGPAPRYSSCLVPLLHPGTKKEYLLTAFGESGESGDEVVKYLQDIWAYDIAAAEWCEVVTTGEKPLARGRFGAAGKGGRWLAIQGGLDEAGERLGDWWVLMLE
ncbi:galactose oxidase [Morchella conica CCBAS932]|uniref:Galactose oxidase n=1 Tax=Morchella conica CCBAS932 TaxID=1392247 RepID=A0A3N4KH77_9PEZI|nr:galactose oxidase [Morchella conica CCBAS932]